MKIPSPKNLLVIAALLLGAVLVVAGLAINAADHAPFPDGSPSATPSPTESVKTSDSSLKPSLTSSSLTPSIGQRPKSATSNPSPIETHASPMPSGMPSATSACPMTTNGVTKCPEDPYCPGGEFCEGDYGDPAAVPSDWWDSDN